MGEVVAWVRVTIGDCPAQNEQGYMCTRRKGHTGRHAAAGEVRDNGLRPVFAVWPDPAQPASSGAAAGGDGPPPLAGP